MGKFLVRHYHDKRLKPYEGLKEEIHPVYMSISFDQATHNVRSKLWDEMVKNRLYTFTASDSKDAEKFTIETFLRSDSLFSKPIFDELCKYEVECITKIKEYLFPGDAGLSVKKLLKYYSYYGADGLKMISKNLLNELMESEVQSLMFNVITESILKNFNPKTVVLFLDEARYLSVQKTEESSENINYARLQLLASWLQALMSISYMKLASITESMKPLNFSTKQMDQTKLHGFDLFYYPVINFYLGLDDRTKLFSSCLDPLPKFTKD
jgi:hypothetical protein